MINEKPKPSFWAIIPATVRYDEVVGSTAKLLFAEMTALSNQEGYCWASNQYFADLFKISVTQVSRLVGTLEDRKFIKTFVDNKLGNKRKIYPQVNAESSVKESKKSETFEERFDRLVGVVEVGLGEEKKKFIEYFTAKNDGGTKEHWQKQKTFAMKMRWGTWVRNKTEWAKPKFPKDNEIKKTAVGEAIARQEVKSRKEVMDSKRTPEEQARVNKQLAKMRAGLKDKLSLKP